MPLWGVHIGIAVIITSLIVGYYQPIRLRRWILIFISGVFAVIPDGWWLFTERFFPRLQLPWFAQVYRELFHDSLLANLFWFHRLLDRTIADHVLPSVLVAAISVTIFLLIEYYLPS